MGTFAAHHSAATKLLQRWFTGPLQARGQALMDTVSYGLGGHLVVCVPTGPGRGSAGGSYVGYLLGIHLADPIKYGLG